MCSSFCVNLGCLLQEGLEELPSLLPTSNYNKYQTYDDTDDEEDDDDSHADHNDTDNMMPKSVKSWTPVSYFSEVVVWGHETMPDPTSDPYVTGLQDFIKLSKLIHGPIEEDYVDPSERDTGSC